MILLAGFLDVLFRACVFVGLALSVGGIAFRYVVLRPPEPRTGLVDTQLRRAISLIGVGAFMVAVSEILTLVTSTGALADETGRWPFAAFFSTGFARWGMLYAVLAVCLGGAAIGLRYRPRSPGIWATATFLAALLMASGAWLVHGASRLENAGALMTVTIVHQLAAVVWTGGIMHLTAQWRLLHRSPGGEKLWPQLPARFSPLAVGSVALLVAAGLYLYRGYIDGLGGLVGTAYGTMVITKVALMGSVLCLGGINYFAIRRWKVTGDREGLLRRTPIFAEIEAGVGIVILMAAAALTGQPPAVDLLSQRAAPSEVLHVFAPKIPRLTPAPYAEMLAGASSSLDLYTPATDLQRVQSNFNHNMAGIFVIMIGLGALTHQCVRKRWTRHWPLLFLPLAILLILFGEPTSWPLGKEGFWKTLAAADVLQHRMATLLVFGLGIFEWRVQAAAAVRWRHVFPLLCGIGGALLLTHSHSVFALRWAFLIEVSHNAIGILAVLTGAAAWLELKMPGREGRIAGLVWPVCFTLIGVILLFYREVPPV